MKLHDIIWKDRFVEKIERKHRVSTHEVEEVLFGQPIVRKAERGRVQGEDLYAAYGQTQSGRYLVVFFVHKAKSAALPITARDMTLAERRNYERER